MKLIKRFLCVFLSVAILCFGVCTSYFSPHKIDNVQAAGTTILTEELALLICEFFGSYVYGYGSGGEANSSISMDDLAKAGHDFIQRCNPETYPIEDSDIADSVGTIRDVRIPYTSILTVVSSAISLIRTCQSKASASKHIIMYVLTVRHTITEREK